MNVKKDQGPAVKVPPPLIFGLFILLALMLNRWLPMSIVDFISLKYIGWGLCTISLLLAGGAVVQFVLAGTHIEPWKPANSLIYSGFFRYSRNPIYLAFVLFTLGLGLLLNNLWVWLSLCPSILLLQRFVITKEERYLTERFGRDYTEYCQKVRRWL